MSVLDLARAELELRRRRLVADQSPFYDWYGPPCTCPPEVKREDGSCPLHKRARPKQRPPEGPWSVWYVQAGRGFGKTEVGAQWVRNIAERYGKKCRIALVGATAADVRDTMIEGPSGLESVSPEWFKPHYAPSKRKVTWPNGAVAKTYSADEPERLRGPQHTHAWCDEIGTWRDEAAWSNLMFGLRIGSDPQCCVTTTPRPFKWLTAIKKKIGTVVVRGSTYENRSNLAADFFDKIIKKYEGTRLGRQELEAEDLEDTPGALWTTVLLDNNRRPRDGTALEDLYRIVVAIDPSVSDPMEDPDESNAVCGITIGGRGYDDHGYLLVDRSLRASPRGWATRAVEAYHEFQADLIVAEKNNGGDMVADVIRGVDPNVPVKLVWASRGKLTRAEPISSLYEQGKVHHLGDFPELEEQLCTWVPGLASPDRLDSLVWLMTELMIEGYPMTQGEHPFEEWR